MCYKGLRADMGSATISQECGVSLVVHEPPICNQLLTIPSATDE